MDRSRVTARNGLLARTTGIGLALTVLSSALTGALTGLLARPHEAAAQPAEPQVEPQVVPQPRRTVYLQVRMAPRLAQPPQRRAAPLRPPAAPPRVTRQAPVTRSGGS